MCKKVFLLLLIMLFSLSLVAQTKQKKKTSHPSKNTILFEVLKKLADQNVCGTKADSVEDYIGIVQKRDFADDELHLAGFVLKTKGDKRQYINFDSEYISSLAASAMSDLSDWFIVGRKIKVSVYRCRRILYAYKIVGL
jgi:hypothetical protein